MIPIKPGVCDPISDARREVESLLQSLGISDPPSVVRPVFDRVRQRYAGDRPYIPHVDHDQKDSVRKLVQDGLTAGLSIKEIARQSGLHITTVWRAKKEWAI